ncbi:MAG: MFS transporter [Cyanobacteria bacterium SIG26]|nr:MFS transporter [Cyanobacteria bacterium SIG26]
MSTTKIKWIICILIILGNFLGMLDSSSVNLALYQIAESLNITLSQVQWVVIAYMLVLTVFLPFFGKLGDILPKNKLYGYGFLIFALGALLNSTSSNLYTLLTYRCIEALGASVMMANGPSTIATLFKGEQRGKALGINGCLVAVGGLLGPAIGGLLINAFGWRTVFLPGVPIALIASIASFKLLPSYKTQKFDFKFDYKGFIYFTIGLFALLLAISQGHQWGWKSLQIISLGIITLIFGALFYLRDRKINYPLINFDMFKIKTFTFGNIAVMMAYMCMFTNAILLPFYLQEILKFNAFITGLLILPYAIASSTIAPFAGGYSGKHGSHILTKIGPCIYILALLIFITFNKTTPIWLIITASFLMGVGNGLFQSPSNNAIITSVPKDELGVASGILALSRNLGNILGVAITITLFDHFKTHLLSNGIIYETAFLSAFHKTMYFGICFGTICLICASIAYNKQLK